MADVSAQAPVFSRGSTVLDYWLVHAEGLTVEPLGARVEKVLVGTPAGRAEALIVRSRMTRRRRAIAAGAIAAVKPAVGTLVLDDSGKDRRRPVVRPRVERTVASTRAGTITAASWLQRRAVRSGAAAADCGRSAAGWARPRAARAAQTAAHHCRWAGARAARGAAWLAPRVLAGVRTVAATAGSLVLAGAVVLARGTARAARNLEHAAERRRRTADLREERL